MRLGAGDFLLGDCFDHLAALPNGSADLILCDPPYGTTYAAWDSVLPSQVMWAAFTRALKPGGAIVLTASQPFTSMLVSSNPEMFRCEWIWNKEHAANFANANRQPLKQHESVLVFSTQQTTYNPQKTLGAVNHTQGRSPKKNHSATRLIHERAGDDLSGLKYPKSILTFPKHSSQCGLHPTQKPVELFDYLIRTYSNPGDLVVDPTAGSGTAAVAAELSGRRWFCVEKDENYYTLAVRRVRDAIPGWALV